MANFANRSDTVTVLRTDVAALIAAYRQLVTDIEAARDFSYFDAGVAAGTAPLVNGDFVGANSDLTAAQFYTGMGLADNITAVFTAARRKALSQLSVR